MELRKGGRLLGFVKRRRGWERWEGDGGEKLEDLEESLEFNHKLPVGLDEVVPEVVLDRVDALSAYLQQRRIRGSVSI